MGKRLTAGMKEHVSYEFNRLHINPKFDELHKKLTVLADRAYNHVHGATSNLQEKSGIDLSYFNTSKRVFIMIDGARYTYSLDRYGELVLSKPMIFDQGGYSPTLNISSKDCPALCEDLKDLAKKYKSRLKSTNELRHTVKERLRGITTVANLKKVWELGYNLLPPEAKSDDKLLPVVVDFSFVDEVLGDL